MVVTNHKSEILSMQRFYYSVLIRDNKMLKMARVHVLSILILSVYSLQSLSNKCEDFYSQACNDGKNAISAVDQRIRGKDRERLVTMLNSIKGAGDSPFKSYYESCLKRDGSEKFLESKMKALIRKSFRGEPLKETDLAKLLDETSTLNNGFFDSGFEHKDKNTFAIVARNKRRTEIENSSDLYEEYKQFVRKLFDELDCLYDEKEWDEVLKLEQDIIELTKKSNKKGFYINNGKIFYNFHNKKHETQYNMNNLRRELEKFSVKSQKSFNLANFLKFFEKQVTSRVQSSKVVFMGFDYFKGLQDILRKYPFNVTARYIMLQSTLSLFGALPQDFLEMAKDIFPKGYHLYLYSENDKDSCNTETQRNLKYLEEQFYMDTIFTKQIKSMANDLFKSIKENLKRELGKCQTEDIKRVILEQIKTMNVHLGQFDLPYVHYKKTSFYNGSYFENLLAFKRDFIRIIAPGEKGIGLQNVTDFQRARKLSYYDEPANTLYVLPYVFNTTTKHASEFFGTAGPHIVEAIFGAIGKTNLEKCIKNKKKNQGNTEEYIFKKKLDLTNKAFEEYRKTNKSETTGNQDLQLFFLTLAKEFCHIEQEKRLCLPLPISKRF